MKRVSHDALVVGGGIAGVRTSIELARCGFTVALIEKRNSGSRHDKSLFVDGSKLPRELLELGNFHPIRNHRLLNADRPDDDWGKRCDDAKTGVIDYFPVISTLTDQMPATVERIYGKYMFSTESAGTVTVTFKCATEQRLTVRYLIDASGDTSTVSRNHSTSKFKNLISDDPLVAWMRGVRAVGDFDPSTVYDPIGKDIGGTSWVTPLSSSKGDIIASGVSRLSEVRLGARAPILKNLIQFCEKKGICKVAKVEKQLGGIIRSEPISLRDVKKSARVWQIGQAAGMADPLMAEAFSPAYLLPTTMVGFICEDRTPADFHNYWRFTNSMFNYDLMLAMLRRRYAYQRRGVVGSGSAFYKTLTLDMSSNAVHTALSERRIPFKDLRIVVSKILRDSALRTAIIELLAAYAKTVLADNIAQRIRA
jgi:flavin-dependent dehydrogenase